MKKLGLFLLAKDRNAIIVAFFCALLPIFNIPVGFVAVIIVGLVTLQKGFKSGLYVLAWVALPAIAQLVLRHVGPFDVLLLRCVIIWILSALLRRYQSWRLLLEFTAIAGIIFIALLHSFIPNLQQWWINHLTAYIQKIISESHWKLAVLPSEFAQRLSPIATGVTLFFAMCSVLIELIIARFWQYNLVNPGGFSKEFIQIRAGRIAVIVSCVLLALTLFKIKIATDALPVALFPFFIAGLSLLHYWLSVKKQLIYAVILIYAGLFFMPVIIVSLLAVMACVDSWCDFRKVRVVSGRSDASTTTPTS